MSSIVRCADLFFTILLVGIVIDFSSNNKKCLEREWPVIIFHHILSTMMHFGWLFDDKRLLAMFVVLNVAMLTEWATFGYCRITRYVNRKCDRQETEPFHDLIWALGLKKVVIYQNVTAHVLLTILFLCIGIMKLQKKV